MNQPHHALSAPAPHPPAGHNPLDRGAAREAELVRRSRQCEGGFNLVEVALAVALVGVGLIAVFGLLGGGIESSRQVADMTISSQLMADIIAERRGIDYTNTANIIAIPSLVNDSVQTQYFNADGLPTNTPGYYFRVIATVERVPGYSTVTDGARLVITTTWPVTPVTPYTPLSNATTRVVTTQVTRRR